jgi:uncharacterized protein YeaO (DUF488 family)
MLAVAGKPQFVAEEQQVWRNLSVSTLAELRDVLRGGPVTLVTAARDVDGSHVAVLARLLS